MANDDPHPLETYTRAFTESHTQMVAERIKREGIRDDAASSSDDVQSARIAVDDLNDNIGWMGDANSAFLVKVFAGVIAPSTSVVDQTVVMNTALAKVIVDANRPAAMIQIVTAFLGGAISAYTGTVIPRTPPAPPPADDDPETAPA
jgi:hypothetical protein